LAEKLAAAALAWLAPVGRLEKAVGCECTPELDYLESHESLRAGQDQQHIYEGYVVAHQQGAAGLRQAVRLHGLHAV